MKQLQKKVDFFLLKIKVKNMFNGEFCLCDILFYLHNIVVKLLLFPSPQSSIMLEPCGAPNGTDVNMCFVDFKKFSAAIYTIFVCL